VYDEYESIIDKMYSDYIIFDNKDFICVNCRELRECVYYNKHYQLRLENSCNLSKYISLFDELIRL
ncbi:6870_t:CDS:1, partial [Racocetra persica]